jgi:tRNA(adenine34) deaminase
MILSKKNNSDEKYMTIAIKEALKGDKNNEIPVGCIMVYKNTIIAKTYNMTESLHNVTAHAEIKNISLSSHILKDKYLTQCTMYITLEPCIMCAGALYWTQIHKVVFGAYNNKGYYTKYKFKLHSKTKTLRGVLQNKCQNILTNFFKKKRSK